MTKISIVRQIITLGSQLSANTLRGYSKDRLQSILDARLLSQNSPPATEQAPEMTDPIPLPETPIQSVPEPFQPFQPFAVVSAEVAEAFGLTESPCTIIRHKPETTIEAAPEPIVQPESAIIIRNDEDEPHVTDTVTWGAFAFAIIAAASFAFYQLAAFAGE